MHELGTQIRLITPAPILSAASASGVSSIENRGSRMCTT